MNKYKIKLPNSRIVGPFELSQIEELFSKKKLSENADFSLFPIGPWKKLSETPEVNEIYIRITKKKRKDFKEFTFEKTESKNIPFNSPENDEVEEEANDTDSSSIENNAVTGAQIKEEILNINEDEEEDLDSTIILQTQNYRKVDETVIVQREDIKAELEEEDEALEFEEEEVEPAITPEDKTVVVKLEDVGVELLKEATETEKELNEAEEERKVKIITEQTKQKVEEESKKKEKEEKSKKVKKRIGPIGIIAFGIVSYLWFDEPPKNPKLIPQDINISFPSPAPASDVFEARKFYEQGLELYGYIRQTGGSVEDRAKAIALFKRSLELNFRESKIIDGNNVSKINDSIEYLLYLYVISLNDNPNKVRSGEAIWNLIKLIKEKIYTSPLVAESVSIYYQYFDKKIAARNVIENYLRVSKEKSIGLMLQYLNITLDLGDFKTARTLYAQLSNVKQLPIYGYLYFVKFLELDEQSEKASELLKQLAQANINDSKILLEYCRFLLLNNDLEFIKNILLQVQQLKGGGSRLSIAKFYEYKGILSAVKERDEDALKYFQYSLSLFDTPSLRNRLAALESGGEGGVKDLILESKAKVYIQKSKNFLKENKLDVAFQQAIKASDIAPKYLDAQLYLASLQIKKGLFTPAINMLDSLYKKYPSELKILVSLIETYINAYKTNEAIIRLRALSSTAFGETGEYYFLFGLLYEKERDWYKAIKNYEIAAQINPLLDKANYRAAMIYQRSRKYKLAKQRINSAIELDPLNIEYKLIYANILYELQGVDAGIGYIRDLLKAHPDNIDLIAQIAIYYYKSGQIKEFQRYKKIVEENVEPVPRYYDFLIYEAKLEGNAGDVVKYSQKLMQSDPSKLKIIAELGSYYLDLGRYREAEQTFLTLKSRLETYPKINFFLAKTYMRLGDLDKALEFGEEEKKINPNQSSGDSVVGEVYTLQQEWDKAVKSFEKAISKNTKDQDALLNLGWIRMNQRQYERAKDLIIMAKQVDSNNPQVFRVLGDIYKGLNQSTLAIEQYQTYLKMNTTASDKPEVESIIKSLQ